MELAINKSGRRMLKGDVILRFESALLMAKIERMGD